MIAAKCPVHRVLDGEVMFQRARRARRSPPERAGRRLPGIARRLLAALAIARDVAPAMDRGARPTAAVLVPLCLGGAEPRTACTSSSPCAARDLRRHAGEISFPGGRARRRRRDLADTALREAEEEIGLRRRRGDARRGARADLDVRHQLPDPSVRRAARAPGALAPVRARGRRGARAARCASCAPARARTRLERRGIAFETDAYLVGEHVIWGATARILDHLLERTADLDAASVA